MKDYKIMMKVQKAIFNHITRLKPNGLNEDKNEWQRDHQHSKDLYVVEEFEDTKTTLRM